MTLIGIQHNKFRRGRRLQDPSGKYRQYGNPQICNESFQKKGQITVPCRPPPSNGVASSVAASNQYSFRVYVGLTPGTRSVAQVISFFFDDLFNRTLGHTDIYVTGHQFQTLNSDMQQDIRNRVHSISKEFQARGGIPPNMESDGLFVAGGGDCNSNSTACENFHPQQMKKGGHQNDDSTSNRTAFGSPIKSNTNGSVHVAGTSGSQLKIFGAKTESNQNHSKERPDDGKKKNAIPVHPQTMGGKHRSLQLIKAKKQETVSNTARNLQQQQGGPNTTPTDTSCCLFYANTLSHLEYQYQGMWVWSYAIFYDAYWKEGLVPMLDAHQWDGISKNMFYTGRTMQPKIQDSLSAILKTPIWIGYEFDSTAAFGPSTSSANRGDSDTLNGNPQPLAIEPETLQRYLGMGLFVFVISVTAILMWLSAHRRSNQLRHETWRNLACERGVDELLETGWFIEGSRMTVFDKSGWGYNDDDSLFQGGFEQHLGLEINFRMKGTTTTDSPTLPSLQTHKKADFP